MPSMQHQGLEKAGSPKECDSIPLLDLEKIAPRIAAGTLRVRPSTAPPAHRGAPSRLARTPKMIRGHMPMSAHLASTLASRINASDHEVAAHRPPPLAARRPRTAPSTCSTTSASSSTCTRPSLVSGRMCMAAMLNNVPPPLNFQRPGSEGPDSASTSTQLVKSTDPLAEPPPLLHARMPAQGFNMQAPTPAPDIPANLHADLSTDLALLNIILDDKPDEKLDEKLEKWEAREVQRQARGLALSRIRTGRIIDWRPPPPLAAMNQTPAMPMHSMAPVHVMQGGWVTEVM